jgi:regulator of protease activity HflC (stomatin/prohibitin superfamily)
VLAALIVLAVLVLFVLVMLAKTIRVIPQAKAGVVERLGRYSRTGSRSSFRSSTASGR